MFPGRSAARSVAEWCAAEPGPLQTLSLGRSRISGAPLRAAPHPGNAAYLSAYGVKPGKDEGGIKPSFTILGYRSLGIGCRGAAGRHAGAARARTDRFAPSRTSRRICMCKTLVTA